MIWGTLKLLNPLQPDRAPLERTALVDPNAVDSFIPEPIRIQLGLETRLAKEVCLAPGERSVVPYAGPVEVHLGQAVAYTGVLVTGDRITLGRLPLAELDLVVEPATGALVLGTSKIYKG